VRKIGIRRRERFMTNAEAAAFFNALDRLQVRRIHPDFATPCAGLVRQ
jgi:hypothetical protein